MHLSVHFSNMLLLYTLNIHYLCQFVKVWFRRFCYSVVETILQLQDIALLSFRRHHRSTICRRSQFLGGFRPKVPNPLPELCPWTPLGDACPCPPKSWIRAVRQKIHKTTALRKKGSGNATKKNKERRRQKRNR